MAKQKGQVKIKVCDDNRDPFIATLHNVLLVPDLCDRLFSIITLINSGHNFLFRKVFCTVYFRAKEKKCGYITTWCTKETCVFGVNEGNVKDKEIII